MEPDQQDGLLEADAGKTRSRTKRGNDLDGPTWMRYSISVWDGIRKTAEEKALKHPAMFLMQLVSRLTQMPFLGPGWGERQFFT